MMRTISLAPRSTWLWYMAGVTVVLSVGLVIGAAWSIRSGVLAGPTFDIELGSTIAFIAYTTAYPACHPFSAGCVAATRPAASGTQPQYYTVWFITRSERRTQFGTQEMLGGGRMLTWRSGP